MRSTFSRLIPIILIVAFSMCHALQAQTIRLMEFPSSYQLFPRGDDNNVVVHARGEIEDPTQTDTLIFEVKREGQTVHQLGRPLSAYSPENRFDFRFTLPAELANYSFELRQNGIGFSEQLAFADSVVAGDVFIVNGQSNANETSSEQVLNNSFCRTFGEGDQGWYLANHTYRPAFNTGVLGYAIQDYLVQDLNIPICLINGSVSGSWMAIQRPNLDNRADPESIYGRLLDRMERSGTRRHAKALFWFLGEAETDRGIHSYHYNWELLYNAWREDYPGIEKFYVYQIRPGCVSWNKTHAEIREAQRRLDSLDDVELISTNGRPGFDNCHYSFDGYRDIARNTADLVLKQIYDIEPTRRFIHSPNVTAAWYSSPAKDKITIKFDYPVEWPFPLDSSGARMRDYFLLDDQGAVADWGVAVDSMVYLNLRAPSDARELTYLPNAYYDESIFGRDSVIYHGPFLVNPDGIGALSFWRFPIAEYSPERPEFKQEITLKGGGSYCPGDSLDAIAPEGFKRYLWSQGGQGREFRTPGLNTVLGLAAFDSSGNYVVGRLPARLDTAPAPRLLYDTLLQRLNSNVIAADFTWFRNGVELEESRGLNAIFTADSGAYHVEVVYLNGCAAASDSMVINPPGKGTSVRLFDQADNQLQVFPNPASGFAQVLWQGHYLINVRLRIRDGYGRMILERRIERLQYLDIVDINVGTLAAGMYHIELQSGDYTNGALFIKL